jgi:hypothetical protein
MRILAMETTVEGVSSTQFTCEIAVAEARTALASLPMVAAGLIRFEVVPLRAYPGFAGSSSLGSSGLPSRRNAGQHAAGTRDVPRHPGGQLAAEVVGQLTACATALE